jgi:protein phosphatase
MGATLALLVLRERTGFVAHMGDSRVYLFRNGRLQQLTTDHSLVSLLQSTGEITAEEARTHPARNRITRHVGMERALYPDVQSLELCDGDRLLLCTDGLNGMIDDDRIAEILNSGEDPEQACASLVDAANAAGGRDNVTALIVDLRNR